MLYKDKLRWNKSKKKVLADAGFRPKRAPSTSARDRKRSRRGQSFGGSSRSKSLFPKEKKRESLFPKEKKEKKEPEPVRNKDRPAYSGLTVIIED